MPVTSRMGLSQKLGERVGSSLYDAGAGRKRRGAIPDEYRNAALAHGSGNARYYWPGGARF